MVLEYPWDLGVPCRPGFQLVLVVRLILLDLLVLENQEFLVDLQAQMDQVLPDYPWVLVAQLFQGHQVHLGNRPLLAVQAIQLDL
jgi:hypothetical protein